MTDELRESLRALDSMTLAQLRERFLEVVGEPTTSKSKRHLQKRVGWWLQVRAHGEEDRWERIKKRGLELARFEDIRLTAPEPRAKATKRIALKSIPDPDLPPVGTLLVREYKGRQLKVTVLPEGFEFQGRAFPSLSAVAKHVTGSHLSGRAFFGLAKRRSRAS